VPENGSTAEAALCHPRKAPWLRLSPPPPNHLNRPARQEAPLLCEPSSQLAPPRPAYSRHARQPAWARGGPAPHLLTTCSVPIAPAHTNNPSSTAPGRQTIRPSLIFCLARRPRDFCTRWRADTLCPARRRRGTPHRERLSLRHNPLMKPRQPRAPALCASPRNGVRTPACAIHLPGWCRPPAGLLNPQCPACSAHCVGRRAYAGSCHRPRRPQRATSRRLFCPAAYPYPYGHVSQFGAKVASLLLHSIRLYPNTERIPAKAFQPKPTPADNAFHVPCPAPGAPAAAAGASRRRPSPQPPQRTPSSPVRTKTRLAFQPHRTASNMVLPSSVSGRAARQPASPPCNRRQGVHACPRRRAAGAQPPWPSRALCMASYPPPTAMRPHRL
jgi:hypothetical protein